MFYFSLAKELGMTVRQLLSSLDSRELTEWQCYITLENERMKERQEEARNKQSGKVAAKDPSMLSEALKAQLAPKKAGGN
jgi:hypothetical protein